MLRRMDSFDVPVVLEIENRCFKNPWSEFAFWEFMSRQNCYCIVMANKKIIGYGMACLEDDKIHILNIAVEKMVPCPLKIIIEKGRKKAKAKAKRMLDMGPARETKV